MPSKQRRDGRLAKTIGNSRWMQRQRSLIAIDCLIKALEEDRPVDKASSRHLLECLARWRSAMGKLSLDEAFQFPVRGLRHPLEERLIFDRDYAYACELVVLLQIGFKAKEADIAVAEHFCAAPPWSSKAPRLLALKRESVEELRKSWLKPRGPEPELNDPFKPIKEDVAAWSPDQVARHLSKYPLTAIPKRFHPPE